MGPLSLTLSLFLPLLVVVVVGGLVRVLEVLPLPHLVLPSLEMGEGYLVSE